jgi:hypothetical protein
LTRLDPQTTDGTRLLGHLTRLDPQTTDGTGWLGHLTRLDPPLQHQKFGNMAGQHDQNVCDKTSRGVHVDIADYVFGLE